MAIISLPGVREKVNTARISGVTANTDGTYTYTFDNNPNQTLTVGASDAALIQTELGDPLPVAESETEQQSVAYAVEYADESSFQPLAADLELDAAAGTSGAGDTAFLAPMMGHVSGADLTKLHNYIAGLIGAVSITGTRATLLPLAALLAVVFDGVTDMDAIVTAHIDGNDPSTETHARAAFGVSQANDHANTGVEYGVDLKYDPPAGIDALFSSGTARAFKILKALLRSPNDVCILDGDGPPVDGTTGDNFAGKGSLYIDYTNAESYINAGTVSAPVWKKNTRAA